MELIATPTYSDIFDEPAPDLDFLLSSIPSNTVLAIVSMINAQLYLNRYDHTTQFKILNLLIRRQPPSLRSSIISRTHSALDRSEKGKSPLFTPLYNLELVHQTLVNYKDFYIEDTTPEQEINFLQAYLLIAQSINAKYAGVLTKNTTSEVDYFRKNTWPILIEQIGSSQLINPLTGIIKSISFFNFLEHQSPYKVYVQNFLERNQKNSSWNYVLDLMNLIKHGWESTGQSEFYTFSFNGTEGFKTLFKNLALKPDLYNKKYADDKSNYSGIKENPLFEYIDNTYLILDWNSLVNKLHEGLIFDFYKTSGIAQHDKFSKFLDFKRYISEDVIEKHLFKRILNKCFSKCNLVLHFDEQKSSGHPDAYARWGKHIFLFEIKDAFFPAKPINSYNYHQIKEAIDEKYNNHKKGTGQLIKQIKHLIKSPFENKSYERLRLKKRNIVVHPVIIYTDRSFEMPGIGYYLVEEFKSKLDDEKLKDSFKEIKELAFISLDFLIENADHLTHNSLLEILDSYTQGVRKRENNLAKLPSLENLFKLNDSFEQVVDSKLKKSVNVDRKYVRKISEILGLTQGLIYKVNN